MNKFQKAARRTVKFVEDHKVAIAVISTAAVCYKINRYAIAGHDDFLKEHGLYDAFYALTDDE